MRITSKVLPITVVLYAAIVSFLYCMTAPLDHDEHQFMSSAFMVSQHGLHPYRDFAYFHMPNLVYLYAPLYLTPYPFMLARIIVGLCGLGICLLVFQYARSELSGYDRWSSLLLPACLTVLLLHSPLYEHAISHVWNHTPSTLFALMACLLYLRGIRCEAPVKVLFCSGLCLGMAIGIRLTFVPLIIPFVLAITFYSTGSFKAKGVQLLSFCIGGLLANGMALYFMITNFQDFWFGNIGYAALNTLYREEMSYTRTMTLVGKFSYLINILFKWPFELLVTLTCIYCLVLSVIDRLSSPGHSSNGLRFTLLCLPFLLVGCLAPTPLWHQYSFVLIPFLLLLGVQALSGRSAKLLSVAAVLPFVLVAVISFWNGSPIATSATASVLTRPSVMTPIAIQKDAALLKSYIDPTEPVGKILTLSPLYAVTSMLPIYEEFVTGPFAWRVSHLVPENEALSRGLPLRSRIESFVEQRRPRAILTGKELKKLEIPIIAAAKRYGYQRISTPSGIELWLADP